ncbi:amidohydrolase family protein [Paracoccus sp. (in: a-proteobacteria)]|uniref:amidohydrolase family protein n=1 Tax=Paracoccus sp. TaxID=267 RepID=UPI0032205A2B
MLDRRLFLGGAIGMLAGCQAPPAQELPQPLDLGVDAHVHLFNGRDVPVRGFLRQVILPSRESPVPPGTPLASLAELIVQVLRAGTPSAAAELAGVPRRGPAEQEQSLAAGIDAFSAGIGDAAPQARMAEPGRDDALLLAMLIAEAQGGAVAPLASGRQPVPAMTGDELARLILHGPEGASVARRWGATATGGLVATMRWAGLLTLGRRDLLDEALRLYRGRVTGQIQVLIASMVDLEHWLDSARADARWMSPLDDQIALMSHLARDRRDALVLNFAPFCPLRAVVEGPATLRRVQAAVLEQGFAGVKLYPPMGFRASCNDGIGFGHTRHKTGVSGRQIDAELQRLYAWCAEAEVPIQAHANDSMAAGRGTGAYASPVYWPQVLARYPGLRLNLSHAGHVLGMAGDAPPPVCGIRSERDWLAVIARMIGSGQQVWFDTGFWTELALEPRNRDAAVQRLHALEASHAPGKLAARMLYGSDWSMIARLPGHAGYHVGMEEFVWQLYPERERRQGVMGGNALGFVLGSARHRARLARFHAGNEVWRRHLA